MSLQVPRESEGKHNIDITHYTEELCKATIEQDKEGKRFHCYDLTRLHFPTINRSYPTIKTVRQFHVYVLFAMQTLCWNNIAKVVEWDNDGHWYENPNTLSEALNESLPIDTPWENRKPTVETNKNGKTKEDRAHDIRKAEWSVDFLTKYQRFDDQKIYDILTGAEKWNGNYIKGFNAGTVKRVLETRYEEGRYAFS